MDRSSQRDKKRARVQHTLDGFFKKQKVVIPNSNEQTNSLLVSLPDDLLEEKLFGFLDVQELTDLASTCHCMASKINDYRGPLPYIVRQELCPKKIGYSNYSSADRATVWQSQTFRFLIKTKRRRVIQVNIEFENRLWEEGYNYNEEERRHVYWKSRNVWETSVEATIFQQTKYKDGSFRRTEILSFDDDYFELKSLEENRKILEIEDEDHPLLRGSLEDQEEEPTLRDINDVIRENFIRELPSGKHIEDELRDCVYYYWMSAMQAIAIAPNICPSIHYFMSKPMIHHSLDEYFPKQYNYDAKQLDDRNAHAYRCHEPTSYQQWLSTVPNFGCQREYEIHEIPWYRDWYPKPSKPIIKSNLLASLPSAIFVESILPHLPFADLASLNVACPAFSARVMCSLKNKKN